MSQPISHASIVNMLCRKYAPGVAYIFPGSVHIASTEPSSSFLKVPQEIESEMRE
jgi:hypothetical protein